MSIDKGLKPIDPFFVQTCPICGASQRMMIKGLYLDKEGKGTLYPDMGYSFCNCKNIFFTKWENISTDEKGLNSVKDPIGKLTEILSEISPGEVIKITMRDPYFCIWTKPHEYSGFNPRLNFTLWDMDTFVEECKTVGFEVLSAERDMDVESKTPECYHITLRKP